jgi:peptide-methionine (R)-S-oxide reductase
MADEWKNKLTPEQYAVMRCHGTEPPFSSPLYNEKRKGKYVCAACGAELFLSETKYESGTGWPSFFDTVDKSRIATTTDYKIGVARTEYHCAKCGGHLGHVFPDGPAPTGLRYCNNGISLKFVPDKE